MRLVEDFADLFEGRKDAYGEDEGGAARTHPENWLDIGDNGHWNSHLEGWEPIGVYPMVPAGIQAEDGLSDFGWVVKWGCVDFDVKAPHKRAWDYETERGAHEAAQNLVLALESFGIRGWMEKTKSSGRHVWVFAETWVPAATMRRALLVACEIAGASAREVNPKSEGSKNPEYLGNYVRLPYAGDDVDSAACRPRTIVFDFHGMAVSYAAETFVDMALSQRATLAQLESAANLWVPPAPGRDIDMSEEADVGELRPRLGGLTWTILQDGPLNNGDRSTTLARLAYLCREDGLNPSEALAVTTAADLRWGKFHARADGERQLERLVERAYSDWEDD